MAPLTILVPLAKSREEPQGTVRLSTIGAEASTLPALQYSISTPWGRFRGAELTTPVTMLVPSV